MSAKAPSGMAVLLLGTSIRVDAGHYPKPFLLALRELFHFSTAGSVSGAKGGQRGEEWPWVAAPTLAAAGASATRGGRYWGRGDSCLRPAVGNYQWFALRAAPGAGNSGATAHLAVIDGNNRTTWRLSCLRSQCIVPPHPATSMCPWRLDHAADGFKASRRHLSHP